MDNKKIGKLIADLRKKNGLTQQELGDKVGVGFRAVSKWERGLSLPDISIINEISKILGISSDELLAGKITSEVKIKKKMPLKLKISLSVVISLVVIFTLGFIYNNNRVYTYNIDSLSDEYYVEGQVITRKDGIQIIINELTFVDKEFSKTKIRNYEYQVTSNERLIVGVNNTEIIMNFEEIKTVQDFLEKFNVNYSGDVKTINEKDIVENGMKITISFETEEYEKIDKIIDVTLTLLESKKM